MRVLTFAALSVALVGLAVAAPSPGKSSKPVDVKKALGEVCGAPPYGLVELDGKTASQAQLEEAKFQVTAFITQADIYQDCIVKLTESFGDALTDGDIRYLATALKISQDEKESVGRAFNNAVCEYNARHKIADADCKDGKWVLKTVEQVPSGKPGTKPATATKPATKPATATTQTKTP